MGDARVSGRWSSRWILLGLLGIVYVAVYGWLLATSNGMPFVLDNNESFSALTHAANLFHFGLGKSFGLTDEAYGLNSAAHPYVHTHQGDFPRLFAFLLYVFGAQSIESQITITTFTIGVAAVYFAYLYFAKTANSVFAFLTCSVFLTDYIFFAEWQAVTYRVWHAFFFFGALVCSLRIGTCHRKRWAVLTAALYACLFYYEYIFVAFVAITVGVYSAWLYRRKVRTALLLWGSQLAGATLAVGILLIQLIAYMGVSGTVQDLYLTYVARNDSTTDPNLQAELQQFYDSHNIVFFYNLVDGSQLRGLRQFTQSLFDYHLETDSPVLIFIVVIIVFGWLVGFLRRRDTSTGIAAIAAEEQTSVAARCLTRLQGWIKAALLTVCAYAAVANVLSDRAFLGLLSERSGLLDITQPGSAAAAIVAAAATLAVCRVSAGRWFVLRRVAWGSVLRPCLVLLTGAVVLHGQGSFYIQGHSELWLDRLELWVPELFLGFAVLGALALAVGISVAGTRNALGNGSANAAGIVPLLAGGSLAYALVYAASPGYVLTGYLQRWAPLGVFVVDAVIGVAFYVVLRSNVRLAHVARLALRESRDLLLIAAKDDRWRVLGTWSPKRLLPMWGAVVSLVLLTGLTMFSVSYWAHLQLTYVTVLPPTHFSILKELGQPPFRGASFIANTYAAPIAWFTGQWAYSDPRISSGKVAQTDKGFVIDRDATTYLWLADKNDNPEYLVPEYYMCLYQQNPVTAWVLMSGHADSFSLSCTQLGIVGEAASPSQWSFHHTIVAADDSPAHAWAILRLDWDYPPFLDNSPERAQSAVNTRVSVSVAHAPSGVTARVIYTYAQQGTRPEVGSEVRLYGVMADGQRCLLSMSTTANQFALPADFEGTLQASVVPRTATKAGAEVFSAPTDVGHAANGCVGSTEGSGLAALDAPPGTRLSQTNPVVGVGGQNWPLTPGDMLYMTDSKQLLRFTSIGFVPVVGHEGDRVRLSTATGPSASFKHLEPLSAKFVNGGWTTEPVAESSSAANN